MCETRDELEQSLSRLVGGLDAASLRGADAKALVGFFSRVEHLAAAGKALCALRVLRTGVFELDGHAHGASWLAEQTGDSIGEASSLLEATGTAESLPELKEAFCSGELSSSQLKHLAGAAALDPGSLPGLLDTARVEDLSGLKRRCAQVRSAALSKEDEAARTSRIYSQRRLRTWIEPDGTFRLDARLTTDQGARLLGPLNKEADRIFKDARRSGRKERHEAYLLDSLVALVTRTCDASNNGPKALVHVRVDIEALRRGSTFPGEVCEIPGVGPISVATARDLLGDGLAKVLITSATDVYSICNLGRAVPAKVMSALIERDRCCVVPGCGATYRLEVDHRVVPFASGGPTELANLARLCHHHHFLRTHEGYSLEGGPGAWVWIHPDGRSKAQGVGPPPEKAATPVTPATPATSGPSGPSSFPESSPGAEPDPPPEPERHSSGVAPPPAEQSSLFASVT